jgi:hypothetical protein
VTPPTPNPYASDLAGREPLDALRDTAARIRVLVEQWSANHFERSYAPGKWTARQILIHLAQTELALGNRARMALATPNYVAQAFDQNVWMDKEAGGAGAAGRAGGAGTSGVSARVALDALISLSAMNRAFFASLSADDRATSFSHPEYGALTIDWLIHQIAGHGMHHLKQLETIGSRSA